MSESTQTKLLSSVPAISSLAEGDKITVVTAAGQTALVSLSALLGALKVGGRNLLKGSGVARQTSEYGFGRFYLGNDLPKVGENVIVTIWGQLGNDRTHFQVFHNDGDGLGGAAPLSKVGDGIYQARFLILKESKGYFVIYHAPSNGTSVSTIERIKVERGNIPTDWTPAPEDIWGGNFLILRSKQGKRPNFKERRAAA